MDHIVAIFVFDLVVSIVSRQRTSSDVFFGDDVDRVPKHNSRTPVNSMIQFNKTINVLCIYIISCIGDIVIKLLYLKIRGRISVYLFILS